MTNRSAHAALLGYYYQFDKTVEEFFTTKDLTDIITVEGIEDIDLTTATEITAIQCKHYAAQKYTPSTIREPVQLMLDHYCTATKPIQYRLYTHFEDFNNLPELLSLADLKAMLTYKHDKKQVVYHELKKITDPQLEDFLSRLKIIRADTFEDQHTRVLNRIKTHFNCSGEEADCHFYNNALRFVIDHATKPDIGERSITKSDFLAAIDTSSRLFSLWYVRLRSMAEFVKKVRSQIATCSALHTQKHKALFLEESLVFGSDEKMPFVSLVELLIERFFLAGTHLIDATPWTLILSLTEEQARKAKTMLIEARIIFSDGYEHISFSPFAFNQMPVCTAKSAKKGSTDLLGASSYTIRVITAATYRSKRDEINAPQVLFFLSSTQNPADLVGGQATQIFQLPGIESLSDLAGILQKAGGNG